jgi:hypothetical protein
VAAIKRQESGKKSSGYLPFTWRTSGGLLQLEEKVFWDGQSGTSAFEKKLEEESSD